LIIKNRLAADSIIKGVKNENKKNTNEKPKELQNITHYSNLFYLLQTNPKYLSKILYLVPSELIDKFLQTVILTLYGYAFSSREEYLILNLFKETLKLEVEKDDPNKIGNFLASNPILTKMVVTYGRRLQGMQFLQKVLYTKLLEPVIKERQLNLNLDAVKYLKEYISNKEVETGEKNTKFDVNKITFEIAMQEEHVSKEMNERAQKLCELCEQFIVGLTDNVSQLPYGLRYVCKMFDYYLKLKHPKSTEPQRSRVVGFVAFYKFMNPAIVSPDGYELTRKPISTQTRQNLIAISKVLINLSNGVFFDTNIEPFWKPMNDWIQKYEDLYLGFIKKIIQVPDSEEQLGVDEYMELTQKSNPTITIKWNEIFQTHKILVDFLNKVATDDNDPLKIILSEKGMEKST